MCNARVDLQEVIQKFDVAENYFTEDLPGLETAYRRRFNNFEGNTCYLVLEKVFYLL